MDEYYVYSDFEDNFSENQDPDDASEANIPSVIPEKKVSEINSGTSIPVVEPEPDPEVAQHVPHRDEEEAPKPDEAEEETTPSEPENHDQPSEEPTTNEDASSKKPEGKDSKECNQTSKEPTKNEKEPTNQPPQIRIMADKSFGICKCRHNRARKRVRRQEKHEDDDDDDDDDDRSCHRSPHCQTRKKRREELTTLALKKILKKLKHI